MSNNSSTIGCAGAGILGSAIARRLFECGFAVSIWNRDREKVAPLVELGAVSVDTPADLAADRDIVLTCVTDGKAVESIVFGSDGVAAAGAPGKLRRRLNERLQS
jgi:3-hydroxyisobutyrate dehydrogenase